MPDISKIAIEYLFANIVVPQCRNMFGLKRTGPLNLRANKLSSMIVRLQRRDASIRSEQERNSESARDPLSRIRFGSILRSYVLTWTMSSPILLRPSLAILNSIATSKPVFLNPDRNAILGWLLKHTIYDHFCSGATKEDVLRSANSLKAVGFHGIILGHAKEIVLKTPSTPRAMTIDSNYPSEYFEMVDEWKKSNLDTVDMIGPNDFIAIK